MKRFGGSIAALTLAGVLAVGAAVGEFVLAADERAGSSSPRPQPAPSNIKPLPRPERTPLPPMGGYTPLPGARPPRQDAPTAPPRERVRRDTTEKDDDNARRQVDRDRPHETTRRDDHRNDRLYRNRRQGFYNDSAYGRYPRYGDGYRGYNPQPPVAPDDGVVTDRPADRARPNPLLPPDDLLGDDDDAPAELKKLLDGSPQYREATAQLLRAWADYARAAEKALQRLRPNPRYQKALSELADAEAKAAEVRDRPGMPAVNLVTAAQRAMLARRAVRKLEETAIDADPVARRAKQKVDDAVERRSTIRDDLAAKLPAGAVDPDAAE